MKSNPFLLNDINPEIISKLNSPEFKAFLLHKLAPALNHPIVNQPRIMIPDAEDDYECDYSDDEDDEYSDEFQLPPKKDKSYWEYKSRAVIVGKDFIKGQIKPKAISFRAGTSTPVNNPKSMDVVLGKSFRFYHDGVIAGGAIAALANEFIHGVTAVINDIDYFYYSNCGFHDIDQLNKVLYENLSESSVDSYGIVTTSTDGLVNLIKIQPQDDPQRQSFSWKKLLDTFDLNCTMAAFHPITQELYFSSSFLSFLNNRKIDHVAKSEFNLSNIIRGKRKSAELQASYYLGDHIRKIITRDLKDTQEWGHESSFLGKLKLSPKSKNKAHLLFISKKDRKTIEDTPDLLSPFLLYQPSQKIFSLTQNFPILDFFNSLKTLKLDEDIKSVYSTLTKSFSLINPRFPDEEVPSVFYERLIILKKAFKEFKYRFEPSYLPDHMSFDVFSNLLKQNLCEKKFSSLITKIKGHDYLFGGIFILVNSGWSFSQVDSLYRRVINADTKLVGILENLLRNQKKGSFTIESKTFTLNFADIRINETIALINEVNQLVQAAKATRNILRPKENLRFFNSLVYELTTINELEAEGKKMHHCVGGYSDAVRSQRSRIFHLKLSETEFSTLEVNIRNQGYTINQNKMISNKPPTPKLDRLARLLTKFLNQKIIKEDLQLA